MSKMSAKRAQWYCDTYGPDFVAALYDKAQSIYVIGERFGIEKTTVHKVRCIIVPKEQRIVHVMKITPEVRAEYAKYKTPQAIAKAYGISIEAAYQRYQRFIGTRYKPRVRYTDANLALLRSSLPLKYIAAALGIPRATVVSHRVSLKKDGLL